MFAVKADLGLGDEVALHEVMTWPKLSDAVAFCERGEAAVSKQIIIAEMGASFAGGMTMVVGAKEAWAVRLGNDRMVTPPKPGQVLSVLAERWDEESTVGLWVIQAEVKGHIMVSEEGVRYVARQ